jgi:hypothetical protein
MLSAAIICGDHEQASWIDCALKQAKRFTSAENGQSAPFHHLQTIVGNALACRFVKYGQMASATVGTFPDLGQLVYSRLTKR